MSYNFGMTSHIGKTDSASNRPQSSPVNLSAVNVVIDDAASGRIGFV